MNYDTVAYKTYTYKLNKFGLSKDKPLTEEQITLLWQSEDRYREENWQLREYLERE